MKRNMMAAGQRSGLLATPAVLALLALFIASGCAALIYEIVWFQLLTLVIGSSTVSLGILLATYMGGLCIGSVALSRVVSARHPPLLIYGWCELGIGAGAIALLFGLPFVAAVYVTYAEHGLANFMLRGVICALLLLPPTILMGATLPAIARLADTSREGAARLGVLYTGNIVGAIFGCLLAGFYLLRVYDMATATYVAAAINAGLAAAAFALSRAGFGRAVAAAPLAEQPAAPNGPIRIRGLWSVYLVIGLSGLTALGCQVVWTRVLGLMLGQTVYTFSVILAVFLIGLGLGSGFGSFLARTTARPRLALGLCQLLLVVAVGWAAAVINGSLPYWPINPSLSTNPWDIFQIDLVRVMWAILPSTCLWGASFPLALAAAAAPGDDPGRVTGAVYAANTIGAIAGAVLFSIVLIPAIGSYQSQRLLIALCLLAGCAMLAALASSQTAATVAGERQIPPGLGLAGGAAAAAVAAALVWVIPGLPAGLLAFGRELPQWRPLPHIFFAAEGINSSIAVSELDDGTRSFHVNGIPEASSGLHDMRVERMLGHLPGLLHPQPRSVLIVGFGAGVTSGSFVLYPGIKRIVICELEPLIPRMVGDYFIKQNHDVAKDPRVEIVYDDARHFLLTTRERFDIITSDPVLPWIKGSATLYTRDYYELAKQRLNPGGVVAQWVPFYQATPDVVKSELATFFSAFPGGVVFLNEGARWNADSVAVGRTDPRPIEPDVIQLRLDGPDYARVKESLAEVEFNSIVALLATYGGSAAALKDWLKDAQINTDRNLRLQYLAGMGSTAVQGDVIYDDLVQRLQFPDDLFAASEQTRRQLRDAMFSHAPPEQ
jgi:spermidine synthase